jgi:hypothetical protein
MLEARSSDFRVGLACARVLVAGTVGREPADEI